MKNLQSFYNDALALCNESNIPYGTILSVETSTRMSRSLGITYRKASGFIIRISMVILQDDIPNDTILSVLIHEILHTIPGCFNHGHLWKEYAAIINHAYPNLIITQYADPKKLSIPTPKKRKRASTQKKTFRFICKRCKKELIFYKKNKFVKHHKDYRCTCGGKFKKIKAPTK